MPDKPLKTSRKTNRSGLSPEVLPPLKAKPRAQVGQAMPDKPLKTSRKTNRSGLSPEVLPNHHHLAFPRKQRPPLKRSQERK